MTKRIILITTDTIGFNEIHNTRRPVDRRYQNNPGDVFPQFVDTNVKIDLDEARKIGGMVLLVTETSTTYSSQRIHACPECGWPMRRQHGKTPHYVCARNERRREHNLKDDQHAYLRAWTEEELSK